MDTITITLTREEIERIMNALNTEASHFSGFSMTIGVDCMHPDLWHREWDKTNRLWVKIYEALHPETVKED